MLLKTFLLICIFLLIISSTSYYLNKTINKNLFGSVDGFIVVLFVNALIATPILIFKKSFTVYLFSILIVSIVFVVYFLKKYGIPRLYNIKLDYSLFNVIATVFVIIQIIATIFLYKLDYDDSFYLPLANQSMFDESLYSYDSSTGNKDFPMMAFYELESWELLLGLIGYLFQIPIPILAHTIIPIILIPLSYLAYAKFFSLFVEKKYIALMIIFISLFHLMGAYSSFSQGNFLLARMWHGKAIYLNIMLPLLQYYCIRYLDNKEIKNIIFACGIIIASISLNPSSIYLSTFFIVAIIVAGSISEFKDIKSILKLSITFVPIGCYVLLLYSGSRNYLNNWMIEELQPLNFLGDLTNYIGKGYYFYFLLLIPIILLKNKQKNIRVLSIYTIVLFILFINPFSAKVLAEYFTSAQTYWRIFWLIPLGTIISLAGVLIYTQINKNKILKYTSVLLFSLLLILSGSFIYSKENKFIAEWNPYKIPLEVVEVSNYLKSEEKIKIVASEEVSMYIRSIASNVELLYTRYAYMIGFLGESPEFNDRVVLYEIINGNIMDYTNFFALIENYDINKAVIEKENKDLIEFLSKNNTTIEYQTDKYIMYKFK